MKLKLLLGTLMLTALTANAQVATINENFNNFTTGNTTFPQSQWSAVLPAAVSNPTPLMIVFDDTVTPGNKYIQAYSGANQNTPMYLVSPQIVPPTGDKTLKFKVAKNSIGAPGTVEVGMVSSPSDMSTFVSLGAPTFVSTTTYQTISIPVPSSSSSYIAFKFTGPLAPHTALHIDDVVYNTTASLGVSDHVKSSDVIQFAVNANNTALEFLTKKDPKNIQIYSAAGQKTVEGKLNNQKFDIASLQSGTYYMLIETAEGSVIKSKFIKK